MNVHSLSTLVPGTKVDREWKSSETAEAWPTEGRRGPGQQPWFFFHSLSTLVPGTKGHEEWKNTFSSGSSGTRELRAAAY